MVNYRDIYISNLVTFTNLCYDIVQDANKEKEKNLQWNDTVTKRSK